MTDAEKILFSEFFTKYGSPTDETDKSVRLYITRPDKLDKLDRIEHADQVAAEKIAELEKCIDFLKIYRRELVTRYNEITTAATVPGVKLVRKRGYYDKKVTYQLITYTHYVESDQDVTDNTETFKGTDRNIAIKTYKDYVKAHPGILAGMDIEKRRWEK
jgi:hypothetical protein